MRNRKNVKRVRKNVDHDKDLSVQVSSSSIKMNDASKKRKNVTPNVFGSMTDADETGLTQSPKGQKSSRLISYNENENEEKDEEKGAERGQKGGIRRVRRVGGDDKEKELDKKRREFMDNICLNFNLNDEKYEERNDSSDVDGEDDHDATYCVNKIEERKERGRVTGKGKGKERHRSAMVNDYNNRSRSHCEEGEDIEVDPDLDVEGMWREVAGEGERDKDGGGGVGSEDRIRGKEKESNGDYTGREMEGEGEKRTRDGRIFKMKNDDIATIQPMEGLLNRNIQSNHAPRNEKERESDKRNDCAEFSTDEDSDDSNETSSSSPSPSRFSAPSSSSPSFSLGSMGSYQCNNDDISNSSRSSCSSNGSSDSNEELDALVIKEQEISKMIQLSQSVGRTRMHTSLPFHSMLFIIASINSFIHSFICHCIMSTSIITIINQS